MIQSFDNKETLTIWKSEGYDKKADKQLPVEKWEKAKDIMEALDTARTLDDVEQYDPDHKSGDLEGIISLDIDDQYRVLFEWDDGDAYNVFAGDPDYH